MKCAFAIHGCSIQAEREALIKHEDICHHREIVCVGHHRGYCNKIVTVGTLYSHATENKCARFLNNRDRNDASFVGLIGDFTASARITGPLIVQEGRPLSTAVHPITIFGQHSTADWPPVFLLNTRFVGYLPYLNIQRLSNGSWMAYVRAFIPNVFTADMPRLAHVEIKMFVPSDRNKDAGSSVLPGEKKREGQMRPVYMFRGHAVSSTLSVEQVIASGQYLCVRDDQVKKLAVGNLLFEYEVRMSSEPLT